MSVLSRVSTIWTFVGRSEMLTESMTPCKASNPPFTGKTWSLLSAIFASYKGNKLLHSQVTVKLIQLRLNNCSLAHMSTESSLKANQVWPDTELFKLAGCMIKLGQFIWSHLTNLSNALFLKDKLKQLSHLSKEEIRHLDSLCDDNNYLEILYKLIVDIWNTFHVHVEIFDSL